MIFYFVISLLIATLFCWLIFLVKNNMVKSDIKKEAVKLQGVGTNQQKEYEQIVIGYQKKIGDFAGLLKSHEFASNVFAFMEKQTMPNIWFKQFGLDEKNNGVQLSGEADSMDAFSRQVTVLESESNKKYIKNIGNLNTSLGDSARIQFSMDIMLDQSIFDYLSSASPILTNSTPSDQPAIQQ